MIRSVSEQKLGISRYSSSGDSRSEITCLYECKPFLFNRLLGYICINANTRLHMLCDRDGEAVIEH